MSKDNFNIIFFELDNDACPVQSFLDSRDDKMAAKMRMPYSEHLEDVIFEVRAKFGSNITRVLYFFYVGKTIVMTNGFVKKTQKTPKAQIKKKKKYRKIFLERSKCQ